MNDDKSHVMVFFSLNSDIGDPSRLLKYSVAG